MAILPIGSRVIMPFEGQPEVTLANGQVVAFAGPTAAGDSARQDITLPAGGPWKIWGVFAQAVRATATAGESIGGHFRIEAASGDVVPNPAPSRFPVPQCGSFLGLTESVQVCPLVIWPVAWEAPGKAIIGIFYNEPTAVTVASQVVAGYLYGLGRPMERPIRFIDRVRATVTSAARTSIGTITLPEKATRISYIGGTMVQDGVLTAGEELIGFFDISSDDVDLVPMQFPASAVYGAGLGATVGNMISQEPSLIPVDIPIIGGSRIDCNVDLNTAVTNAAECTVFIAFE